ncbi:hypothetical protein QAD02_001199 [Eretmocerus hayati]|uniref:Uncharacterized protein n=1 Tax=Eretmocerus hayati TaxID=131215 RepID=A0ACC2NFH9_9HYME|nr:hypothetical protein QAD02_001199 [Eretmocerus hayati]
MELRIEFEIFHHSIKMQAQPTFTPKFLVVLFHGNNNHEIDGNRAIVPKKCMVVEAPANQPSVVQYLPPPYKTQKKVQAINRVVLAGEDVPASWQQFFCTVTHQCETIEGTQYCLQNPNVSNESSVENMVIENDLFNVPNGSEVNNNPDIYVTDQQPAIIPSSSNSSEEPNGVVRHDQSMEDTSMNISQNLENVDTMMNVQVLKAITTQSLQDIKKGDDCDIRITDLVDRFGTLTNKLNDQHDLNISNITIDDIAKKFDMSLPTQTLENFQLFDGKLLDEKLRKIMVSSCCVNVIYRAFRVGPMRYVFRDKDGNSMDESLVKKSVGTAINSSTDRGGARKSKNGTQDATASLLQNGPGVSLQREPIAETEGAPQVPQQEVLQFPHGLIQRAAELPPVPPQEVNTQTIQ